MESEVLSVFLYEIFRPIIEALFFTAFKYILILIGIVLLIWLIIRSISNKDKEYNNHNSEYYNQNNNINPNQRIIENDNIQFDNRITMIGNSGLYAGQKLEFFNSIIIGRDPNKVNLIFENNSRGVSSLHCRVYKEQGIIKIIDFSSSYGTYVNGRRIQPQIETKLSSGDNIYLGFPENSFMVL